MLIKKPFALSLSKVLIVIRQTHHERNDSNYFTGTPHLERASVLIIALNQPLPGNIPTEPGLIRLQVTTTSSK